MKPYPMLSREHVAAIGAGAPRRTGGRGAGARPRTGFSSVLLVSFVMLPMLMAHAPSVASHEAHGADLNSGPLERNETYRFVFGDVGVYHYRCAIHPHEADHALRVYGSRAEAEAAADAAALVVGDLELVIEQGIIKRLGAETPALDVTILRGAEVSWQNRDDPNETGYHALALVRHEALPTMETPFPAALAVLAIMLLASCRARARPAAPRARRASR